MASSVTGCAAHSSSAHGAWQVREESIMGTSIRVELWSNDAKAGNEAIDAVMQEMHRIDQAMSPYKPESELSRINRDAASRDVAISAEMCQLLQQAERFSCLSDGAFDITYAAVGRLYDYRQHIRPSAAEVAEALKAVNYRHVQIDARAGTVRFLHPGTWIDLGGFAKGHAVDNAAALLRARGIEHAHVSAGGDSRVIGDRRGRPWSIGVRDPARPGEVIAVLPLENTSISTSGDYERCFVENGTRFHHLIDPGTGQSPNSLRSVTVLGDDGLTTEAFSKCVFVLGLARGMQLLARQPGLDAIAVDAAGALHYSSGLAQPHPINHRSPA